MKQDQYPAYTMLTNSALSNAIALECIIKAYIDEQETEFLESAFCIASEQVWIGPYISIHFLSLNPLLVRRRRYSRGERYPSALCGCHSL